MRKFIDIVENALNAEIIQESRPRGKVLFHGTSSEQAAKSIAANGIVPPNLDGVKDTMQRPVIGRVYLTPDLSYAAIYAIGGDMMGHTVPNHFIEKNGRYGYVFCVRQSDLKNNIQPDEDEIGEMLNMYLNGGPSKFASKTNARKYEKLKASPIFNSTMGTLERTIATQNEVKKIKDGEYAYYARLGKKALKSKYFTSDMVKMFIDAGVHVAHEGGVIPFQAWRIDKTRTAELKKDGSNFFKIAELIPLERI